MLEIVPTAGSVVNQYNSLFPNDPHGPTLPDSGSQIFSGGTGRNYWGYFPYLQNYYPSKTYCRCFADVDPV